MKETTLDQIDWDSLHTTLTEEDLVNMREPVGRIIMFYTVLDTIVAALIATASGLGASAPARHITATLDSANKKRILDSIRTIYESDPHGHVPDFKPLPELAANLKKLSRQFEELGKIRNTVAHGYPGKNRSRLFMASMAAPAMFRSNGNVDRWVYFDEIDTISNDFRAAQDLAHKLNTQFAEAQRRLEET